MIAPARCSGTGGGWLFFAALLLYGAGAQATGLQVTPTSLIVAANRSATGVWLSNTGDQPLHAQIRVYHWSQEHGADELTPSEDLIISPPMVELAVGASQFVRVLRPGPAPAQREDAFRILVDELPIDEPASAKPAPTGEGSAVRFVLRYSLPVFLAPPDSDPALAQLEGEVDGTASPPRLIVRNRSGVHAQLGNLVLVSAQGERRELSPGLLGYVLAGQTMRWELHADAATLAGAELQSRINGEPRERKVASLGAGRP